MRHKLIIHGGFFSESRTNSEIKLINIVRKAAQEEFDINSKIVKQNNWYQQACH